MMLESHLVNPHDAGINDELLEEDPREEPKNNNFRFFSTCSPKLLLKGIEVKLDIKSNLTQCKSCLMSFLANNNIETKNKDLLIYLGGGIPFIGGTLEDYYSSSVLQPKKFIYGILIYPFSNDEIDKKYTNLCEINYNSHNRLIIPFYDPNQMIINQWNFGLCKMACLLSYLNNKGENSETLLKASAIAIRFPPLLTSLMRVINRQNVTGRDIITICSTYYTYFTHLINPNGKVLIPPEKIFDYSLRCCNLIAHVSNIPETIPMDIILLDSKNIKPEFKFLVALKQPEVTYFWKGDKKNFSLKTFKYIKIEKFSLKAIEDANKYFPSFTPIDPHCIHSDIGCSIIGGKDHCYFYVPEQQPSNDKNKAYYGIIDPMEGEPLQMSLQKFAHFQGKYEIDQVSSLIDTESIKQVIFLCIDISSSMFNYDWEIPSGISIAMQYLYIFGNKMYSYRIPCLLGLILFDYKAKICYPLGPPSPDFGKKDLDFIRGNGPAYIWNALSDACNNMLEYTEFSNGQAKFPNSKNRIIVISNGKDHSFSGITFMEVTKKLIDNKIIVDTVFTDGSKSNDELMLLSHLTGGLALYPSKLEEGMQFFEEEAFLDINQRELSREPIIPGNPTTSPLRIKSTQITTDFIKDAIGNVKYDTKIERKTKTLAQNKMLTTPKSICLINRNIKIIESRKRRILRELHLAALTMDANLDEYDPNIVIYPFKDNLDIWDLFIKIPDDTYLNKWFSLWVTFPAEYPVKPPEIRFVSVPYHLNVSRDGRICIKTLENDYLATLHVIDIIKEIILLFLSPNQTTPIDIEKLITYTNRNDEYKLKAKESSILVGKDNIQEFIKESIIYDEKPDFQLTYDSDTDVPEYMKSCILKKAIKEEPKKIVLMTKTSKQKTDISNEKYQNQTIEEQQNENDVILPKKIKLNFQIEDEQKIEQKCNEFLINIKDFTIKSNLEKTDFAETNLVEHSSYIKGC